MGLISLSLEYTESYLWLKILENERFLPPALYPVRTGLVAMTCLIISTLLLEQDRPVCNSADVLPSN